MATTLAEFEAKALLDQTLSTNHEIIIIPLELQEKEDSLPTNRFNKLFKMLIIYCLVLIVYPVYLGYAIYWHNINSINISWCEGLGFLLVVSTLVYTYLCYSFVLSPLVDHISFDIRFPRSIEKVIQSNGVRCAVSSIIILGGIIFLIIDTQDDRYRKVFYLCYELNF